MNTIRNIFLSPNSLIFPTEPCSPPSPVLGSWWFTESEPKTFHFESLAEADNPRKREVVKNPANTQQISAIRAARAKMAKPYTNLNAAVRKRQPEHTSWKVCSTIWDEILLIWFIWSEATRRLQGNFNNLREKSRGSAFERWKAGNGCAEAPTWKLIKLK